MKIIVWDEAQAKKELSKRLSAAMDARRSYEREWQLNEQTVFSTGLLSSTVDAGVSFNSTNELTIGPVDSASSNVSVNYVMKNLRFIHSQMSANPPSVVPRPTSSDPDDRRKADAADRLVRYALRQYKLQEMQDRVNLACQIYGTAFGKAVWNPLKGEIVDFNEQTDEVEMEGDFDFTVPSVWFVFPDPDATCWEEVHYVFEEIPMRYEEALFMFPGKEEELEKFRVKQDYANMTDTSMVGSSFVKKHAIDSVRIFQYWEKGTPMNGMQGRFIWHLPDGTPLSSPQGLNPHRFTKVLRNGQPGPAKAELPYNILTDLDIPGTYWGKSVVSYAAALQDSLNRLDNVMLDILQAHGVARLLLPEGAEIADDSITNSTWDIIRYTGAIPPNFMEPLPMPQGLPMMRDRLMQGINDEMGLNDSMQGNMTRETSGFSLQYATQQGNMIRRRLFNKYVFFVEWTYKTFLSLVKENWKETRTIHVLGKEKAFEALDISGMDVASGYDIVTEFGTSLSLDPMTRREELLTLMPLFEKAGIKPRTLLNLLKLNEVDGAYDRAQMAADRQREIFEEMMASDIYIPPREMQEHQYMLEYAYDFIMTAEFKSLPEKLKVLIEQHIREREGLAAQGPAAQAVPPGPLPGPTGQPPPPNAPPGAPLPPQ